MSRYQIPLSQFMSPEGLLVIEKALSVTDSNLENLDDSLPEADSLEEFDGNKEYPCLVKVNDTFVDVSMLDLADPPSYFQLEGLECIEIDLSTMEEMPVFQPVNPLLTEPSVRNIHKFQPRHSDTGRNNRQHTIRRGRRMSRFEKNQRRFISIPV